MSGLNDRVAMRHMDIYMEQEEKYLEVVMMNTERLQSKLQSEMGSRLQYDLSTPPLMWSPWLYYRRVEEGKPYPVLCRRLLKLNDEFVSNKSPFRRERRRFVTIPLISTRPIAAVRSTVPLTLPHRRSLSVVIPVRQISSSFPFVIPVVVFIPVSSRRQFSRSFPWSPSVPVTSRGRSLGHSVSLFSVYGTGGG
ncbi:hypothetical protein ACFE04_012838 [Oxalis oulophora]